MNEAKSILSVIIPAYNEERTITRVIREVLEVPNLLEIIVVDDCSTDNTFALATRAASAHPIVRVLRHAKNSGKTEALKTGFAASTGEIVIVQDADLEYRPSEIHTVIEPILDGYADVVFGSRFQVRRDERPPADPWKDLVCGLDTERRVLPRGGVPPDADPESRSRR